MFGKEFQLTSLEARRQMLLKESELNRIHFLREWSEWKGEIRRLTGPARAAGAFLSVAAKAGAFISILRRVFRRQTVVGEKTSWISSLLEGAKAGISLWTLFRSSRRQS